MYLMRGREQCISWYICRCIGRYSIEYMLILLSQGVTLALSLTCPGKCQKCRASANHWSLARLASTTFVAKKLLQFWNKHCVLHSISPRKPLNINWLLLFYKVLYFEVSRERKSLITHPFGGYNFLLPRNYLNFEINTVFYIPFCRENP